VKPCAAEKTSLVLLMAFIVYCEYRNVRKYRFQAEIVIWLISIPYIDFQYIKIILQIGCFTRHLTDQRDNSNIYIVEVDNMLSPNLHLLKTGNVLKSIFCCHQRWTTSNEEINILISRLAMFSKCYIKSHYCWWLLIQEKVLKIMHTSIKMSY
jgi:hypothetical protein